VKHGSRCWRRRIRDLYNILLGGATKEGGSSLDGNEEGTAKSKRTRIYRKRRGPFWEETNKLIFVGKRMKEPGTPQKVQRTKGRETLAAPG